MAVYSGPEINESGLVLSLDASNYKSFKGEETTNEIVSVTWTFDGTNQSTFNRESTLVTDENLKYKGYETYLVAPGTSLNCYLHDVDLSALRTSTVWTFSCYIKRQDGAAITSLDVYMYYPNSDGAAAGTIENVGDGWYRVSRTRTGANDRISLVGFTGLAANIKYYLSGAQLEKKSYASIPVATNTTRGNSTSTGGGWADLSGNNNDGFIVNGPSYSRANGGSLVFDGIDDTTTFGNILQLGTQSRTYCIWYKMNSTTQIDTASLISKTDNSSTAYRQALGFQSNGNFRIILRAASNASYDIDITNPKIDTNWHYLVWVINRTSNQSLYQDAVLLNSLSISAISAQDFQLARPLRIGSYNNTLDAPILFFNGNIAQVQIYNRVLTEEEIKQNFNASRGRFGI